MRIIAGKFRGRVLASPAGDEIRPTSDRNRESLFNILENGLHVDFEQSRVLDLFAGTGALGLEALSRGASHAVFVERSARASALIQHNIRTLALEGVARILHRDATRLGEIGRQQPFHLIFADPPYAKGMGEQALSSACAGGWLAKGAIIILEESAAAVVRLPVFFVLKDERVYGKCWLRFYKFEKG